MNAWFKENQDSSRHICPHAPQLILYQTELSGRGVGRQGAAGVVRALGGPCVHTPICTLAHMLMYTHFMVDSKFFFQQMKYWNEFCTKYRFLN